MTVEEFENARLNASIEEEMAYLLQKEGVRELPGEICKMLCGKGLTFRQAEIILDIAKVRLKRVRI